MKSTPLRERGKEREAVRTGRLSLFPSLHVALSIALAL